ncbi:EAL domain-containing protein [Shewanella sp. Scap07]|uniref:EAL domain-containing protein n=1 Tax=Shewanella sp. Scap07 TaxID=2589987 RepID=UPI0015BE469E|nr:EAL domain-containing protein [Shewanella sp. Scap07]
MTLVFALFALSSAYFYSAWSLRSESLTDARKLLHFVDNKLRIAEHSLAELNALDFKQCDVQGREALESFIFNHLGSGLFLIRDVDAPPWTYCSVVGNLVIEDKDRDPSRYLFLDGQAQKKPLAVIGHYWQGQKRRDLFIGLVGDDRVNAVRVALGETAFYTDNRNPQQKMVSLNLTNHVEVLKFGQLPETVAMTVEASSSSYPLYATTYISQTDLLAKFKHSLLITAPLSAMLVLLIYYLLRLLHTLRNSLSYQLQVAAEQGDFIAYYQPIVDAQTGRVVAAEALLRWRKSDGSIEPPGYFIQTLEESDLINEVTLQILRRMPTDLAPILAQSKSFRCSINLVPKHVELPDFSDELTRLAAQGFPTMQLAVEITERLPLHDLVSANKHLKAMRDLGVCVELDDAGTGYGGSSYLQELSIDVMKIDKLFVDTLLYSPQKTQVLDANIQLANMLKLQVIAEGVETAAQSADLLSKGVRLQQGYFFAKPLSAADFVDYWQASTKETVDDNAQFLSKGATNE